MGVVHKLRPELIEFVVEQKKLDKNLSCRKIAALVQDKFKFKLSKSSANSILKQAGLSMPAGRRTSPELKKIPSELKQAPPPELKKAPSEKPLVPIHCIKVNLSDGGTFYLDGQMHTLWHSAAQIPEAFSTTTRRELNSDPMVLFFAPGYDFPTEELFKFILSFESPQIKISQLIFYDKELRELEKIDAPLLSRHFIFGVWPWQFKEYIKVRHTAEFLPLKTEAAGPASLFYAAETGVELVSPKKEEAAVKLRGSALKNGQKWMALTQNRPFIILSNFTSQDMPPGELAILYLNRWPDLEGSLQDFSRKVEEFRKRFP